MPEVGREDTSVLEGGRSAPRTVIGLAGDPGGLMAGSDRLSRSSWALVVVGSFRRETVELFWPICLFCGVVGPEKLGAEGVMVVLPLAVEDCEDWDMWPSRDWDLLVGRETIGPPLSETGSRDDWVCVLSWLLVGRGRRDVVCTGLLVNVRDTAVFGREGLVGRVDLSFTFV